MLVQSGWGFPDGYFRISLGTSALWNTLGETVFLHVSTASILFFLIRFLNLLFLLSAASHGCCPPTLFSLSPLKYQKWNFGIWFCMLWEWSILLSEFSASVEPKHQIRHQEAGQVFPWVPPTSAQCLALLDRRAPCAASGVPSVSSCILAVPITHLDQTLEAPGLGEAVAFIALQRERPSFLQLGFEAHPWHLSWPLAAGTEGWGVTRLAHLESRAEPLYRTWSIKGAVYLKTVKTNIGRITGMGIGWLRQGVHPVSIPGMSLSVSIPSAHWDGTRRRAPLCLFSSSPPSSSSCEQGGGAPALCSWINLQPHRTRTCPSPSALRSSGFISWGPFSQGAWVSTSPFFP